MSTQDIREIEEIEFGIYSPEEILNMSVCKIDSAKKSGPGTVYDPRMGTIDSTIICETCNQNAINCPGHFGYIELNEPIVHPLYYKRVMSFLNCFCKKCYRLLITKEQIYLSGLNRFKGERRFSKILEKIEKVDICCQPTGENDENGNPIICGKDQPHISFAASDSSYSMVYQEGKKNKTSIVLNTEEIKKMFDSIIVEDVELMGFDPLLTHPRNFIITFLPVCPPCDRPYVKADGKTCDDDLTIQYIEIIKANNNLVDDLNQKSDKRKSRYKKEYNEHDRVKARASLRFRILTTFNNGQGKAKHTTNGRPIKGIKERLTGKEGQIRNNMMGKRCDQTARTVIGGDPTLKMGELAVPKEIAMILTIPVRAAKFNIESLQKMIDDGIINTIHKPDGITVIDLKRYRSGTRLMNGDIIYRNGKKITCIDGRELVMEGDKVERNGEILKKLKPSNRPYKLLIGWVVDRPLQDGDYVLLNRQPTLHKASMLAMQVTIKPYKTLRMNLAITKPFNADFDGDEMNIHVPQSLEAQAELKMLSAARWNMISAQSSKPNMAIVQDSLLGAYRMTQGVKKLTKGQFFNIAMKIPRAPWSKHKSESTDGMMTSSEILDRIQHIRRILKEKGKKVQCFNGRGLVSLFLPDDLIYEKTNNKNPDEPTVKIWRGVMYEGTLDKNILGQSYNALHQVINKEYGADSASHFIDCIQFSTNNYLLVDGFSVGLGDCLIPNEINSNGITKEEEIRDVIKKCYIEAEGIKQTTVHNGIREIRVNASLNKAKDIGLRIAKDALSNNNNFLSTVHSGSKGDFFNIAQITGLLGQQNLKGQRVPLMLNNGKRSLPHYPYGELSSEMEYESRGFIDRGFLRGLNPRQFYFHAMSGREGISDTAMSTATSGYMQRRIIKLTEDMKVQNDGTVRDIPGKIYQLTYGQNGIDPTCTVKVKGEQEICDISRLVTKLNMKYELKLKKNNPL